MTGDEPGANRPVPTSVAGGSARAEFEHRRARDKEGPRRALPYVLALDAAVAIFALLMAAFGPTVPGPVGPSFRMLWLFVPMAAVLGTLGAMLLPSTTTAWETGALGEERTGQILRSLEAEGFRAIHDRLIPGSRANIDHIVVGPPGVFVVETKSYTGKLSVRRGEVWVAGRRKTGILAQARREAAAVAAVVSPVPVTPLICVHRADLGWFKVEVEGIRIVDPREMVKLLRKAPVQLAPNQVAWLVDRLERALRPAVGVGGGRTAE